LEEFVEQTGEFVPPAEHVEGGILPQPLGVGEAVRDWNARGPGMQAESPTGTRLGLAGPEWRWT
jgi:hypothetical protein